MAVVDMLGQPLSVGDFVVFTNNIYTVVTINHCKSGNYFAMIRIMLVNPSKTTKPVSKWSGDMVRLDPKLVTFQKLKTG